MSVVIIDTLSRGSTGLSPFPVAVQDDLRIAYMTVLDIPTRDAIPEWQRSAYMRVHVTTDGKDYRLGVNVTIAGQVWTEIASSAAFQLISEKNQPSGYVGLEADGFINPAFIKAIYANTSYVVADLPARNALTTLTGDIIVVTDTNDTYVKLNNNPPVNVNGDFSLLSTGAAVSSVNGDIGTVIVDFSSMIAQGGSQASFDAAVAVAPAVAGNSSQIILNTNDIDAIYAILNGLGAATDINIPLYNGGETYNDGDNVVFGAETYRNLYRVRDGQGPVSSIIPTDTSKWEKVGDFYTKQEVDDLMLNVVSNPLLNFNRPIHKLPKVGDVPGSNQLITGIEEIYYGRIDVETELISIDALQIGASIAPTINGKVTRGDATSISQITILDDTNTPVGNPVFVGTDAVIEFSFQVNTPILIAEGSTLTYKIQVDSIYDVLLPAEITTTAATAITPVYPILYGGGATDLNATDKYTELNKLVETEGNKTLTLSSASNKMYFCIPEEYADRVSIVNSITREDLLGSFFPDPPVIEQVDSVGLNTDWMHNYKVYQTTYDSSSNNLSIDFIINLQAFGGPDNLDEIAEGVVNKHLTQPLKEKLANFDADDFLSKAVYDTNSDGIVIRSASLSFTGQNDTGNTIPAGKAVILIDADLIQLVGNISLADKDSELPAYAVTEEAIPDGGTGTVVREGAFFPLDTTGANYTDPVYLGNVGELTFTRPTSGLVQIVGAVLVGNTVNGAIIVAPTPASDLFSSVDPWEAFRTYLKNSILSVPTGDLPGRDPNGSVIVRVIENYTSSSSASTDITNGDLEILGGDMRQQSYDPASIEKNVFDMDSMLDGLTEVDPNIRKVTLTEAQRTKLDGLQPSTFKGTFADPTALRAAFNTASDGDSANVSSTGTVWTWSSVAPPTPPTVGGDWVDSTISSGGDMSASTYDPTGQGTDAFQIPNMIDPSVAPTPYGVNARIYDAAEKTKLAGIEDAAKDDQTAGEIKIAYESNADTNAFLDAEKTKLSGIEAGAKDDQSAAEVPYSNTLSGLTAIQVQAAIDELVNDYNLSQLQTPASTNSTTFQNFDTLTFTPKFSGTYVIQIWFNWECPSASQSSEFRIVVDATPHGTTHVEEPSDTANVYWKQYQITATLVAGVSASIDLEYRKVGGATLVTINESIINAFRL